MLKRQDIYNAIEEILEEENYKANPKFIYAQFVHETGNFESNVFKHGNNVCGMRPSSRKLHSGRYNNPEGSATYDNWRVSIVDYVRYCKQTVLGRPPVVPYKSPTKFYKEFTRRGYATDPKYYEKCVGTFKAIFGDFEESKGVTVELEDNVSTVISIEKLI